MQVIDNVYFNGVKSNKNTNPMHDLKTNFEKILPIVNQTLADQIDPEGNQQFYPNRPKLSDTAVNLRSAPGSPKYRQ